MSGQSSQWEFGELFNERAESRKVYTVSKLNRLAKSLLEGQLGNVWVEGEITGLRRQSSGHIYFSIKDNKGQISCALFRGIASDLSGALNDGEMLLVRGDVTLYEPRGQYQMIVRQVELKGRGALQVQFDKLKAKLQAEGLFDSKRKIEIPKYPNCIGIVTSSSGAAIRDVINVIQRRCPSLKLIIAPCRVQGKGASAEMANTLKRLNEWEQNNTGSLDLILLTRGGGSMEDLWEFNEEILARAISESNLPVVSAIGHEIDILISDFVADVRASTPSAAAELITEGFHSSQDFVRRSSRRIYSLASDNISGLGRDLKHQLHRLVQVHPARKLMLKSQLLDDLSEDLQSLVQSRIKSAKYELNQLTQRLDAQKPSRHVTLQKERLSWLFKQLNEASIKKLTACRFAYERITENIRLLSPDTILSRGYSITSNVNTGVIIRNSIDVAAGQKLLTRLKDGRIISTVDQEED